MMRWNKKVLTVLLQWDYGKASRGVSIEKSCFYTNLQQLVEVVEPLWYDDYLCNTSVLQELVIARAHEIQPDLIFFIPYTNQFALETLDTLKKSYPTYAWFGDDQWRFDDFTSRHAPHFTHVSTTDFWSVSKYRQLGIEPILTQWAGQRFTEGRDTLPEKIHYEFDVSFVGGVNPYRKWFIQYLEKLGVKVSCFGSGWPNGRVDNVTMEKIFMTSRINLNLSNSVSHDLRFVLSSPRSFYNYLRSPKRIEQMKARNFEIPLAGGFQLSNYLPGLERYLAIGDEIATYATVDECAQLIGYYLQNEQLRMSIMLRGHLRAKHEHTYFQRLSTILESIWG